MGKKSRPEANQDQAEGLPTPPPSPMHSPSSPLHSITGLENCRSSTNQNTPTSTHTSRQGSDAASRPGNSISAQSSASRRPSFTTSTLSSSSSSTSSQNSVSTTTSSIHSLRSTNLYSALLGQDISPIAYLNATGQIYGTYNLGRGRRGAISAPSSDYYDGKYERGNGRGGGGNSGESGMA
ncbi:uncharacterized protein BDR25DRAFT_313018 [Lindgomyces ingoldianus]|uniref:Uncharacterized protein n=1 Tax=Lindgomyces ingoldianus TaxID=673940 RepID=A0ACB6QZZ9_9PLEO|nr:uncharacterized protein BDR25DRAFT_313018 [Lindgomyces ingoldianus]KAF2472501.1 hypothetical protein BDR25DRAFT_313018 [Lindgomyces ingoldianus]